ncbi:transcription initiation factor TFIID subunit 9-like [Hordeum vulgare subsp. vulgare]|uniref:Transcription initiation factor TFIID subunit 9 n=1 Tax=Hordeum vulgare subsp. vulgare TaxID=112509 RepID=A0A8I6WYT9_HORVV|nr:transcription initiation factor TFIID subunit 9-like [Hordeum vulgare subsp. vulgare]
MDTGAGRTPPPAAAAAADTGDEPRDARVVREILRSMGLNEGDYEPAVVHQFLMLAHRYARDVLGDALAYAGHAGRASLQADDVHLALRSKQTTFGHEPPGREVFLEMAHSCNRTPLPMAPPGSICLPHNQDMMLGQKYLCIPQMKPSIDNVEGTKNDSTGETSNPKVASPSCKNEDQTSSCNQQSKRVSSQLNAMAARAARRWIMKNRRSQKSQP